MGLLVEGTWHDTWYDTAADGTFQREEASFRDWLSADGGGESHATINPTGIVPVGPLQPF